MAWLRVVGLTPASLSARPASLDGSMAERQQQPLDGDELVAGLVGDLLGRCRTRAPARAPGRPGSAPPPETFGRFASTRSIGRQRVARAALRRAGSARRPCPPGRRAALSGGDRSRTAGGPRAKPSSAPPARSPSRGRYTSRNPCIPPRHGSPPHVRHERPSSDRILTWGLPPTRIAASAAKPLLPKI